MQNSEALMKGLTKNEAEKRLKTYGFNQLENKKSISPIKIFLSQFNDFIVWVLIAATVISGVMGEKADAITILIIVIMNSILGFIQEYKTEKSLEALKKLAAPTSKVIRDGKIEVINAENLVPGDLILLESGDRIPADCMIIQDSTVMVDESLLTGESVGVNKSSRDKENQLYMGTVLLTGKTMARITETGMKTEMGKIANMLQDIESERSPLKERLNSLGKILVVLCIVICAIVTVMGIWRGKNAYEMFLLGVSLAVAAIPEGLAAIVTVALALGVSRMLKRNSLVRKLPAVETLGCTSIICSDKTGTLTQNNMTVKVIYSNDSTYNVDKDGVPSNDILRRAFVYCNDCSYDDKESSTQKSLFGDPTETALVKVFFKDTKSYINFLSNAKRTYDIPFDSDRKMMSVIIREAKKDCCYVKGAPERLIERCKYILINGEVKPLTSYYKDKILSAVEAMSFNALRCIAAAYKDTNLIKGSSLENDLIFLGVAGIIDPPRKEVKDAVLKCKVAGIRPVMITGDHKNTAFAIGKELDLCKNQSEVITGDELDNLSDKQLLDRMGKVSVFARVSPNHKLRIVKLFKKKGYIVAMTGDGVNDAPAVKEADIGISMGISGTDVTKEASSMILLDDNFATIVCGRRRGKSNLRQYKKIYKVSSVL